MSKKPFPLSRSRGFWLALASVLLCLAGCAGQESAPAPTLSPAPAVTVEPTPSPVPEVTVGLHTYAADRTSLSLSSRMSLDELTEALDRFPALNCAAFYGGGVTPDVQEALTERYPGVTFLWDTALLGKVISSHAAEASFAGDLPWTAEALGNILKNCMEHTPEGGTVTVTAEETPIFTRIVVRDTGPGFDPADIPHLFERFYRGSTAGSGSIGIGLAMSRMVIAAQNGTVTADNPTDGGARFTVRFYKSII